jgi:hypothetical protein
MRASVEASPGLALTSWMLLLSMGIVAPGYAAFFASNAWTAPCIRGTTSTPKRQRQMQAPHAVQAQALTGSAA